MHEIQKKGTSAADAEEQSTTTGSVPSPSESREGAAAARSCPSKSFGSQIVPSP